MYAFLGVVDFWRGRRAVAASARADFEFAFWCGQTTHAARILRECRDLGIVAVVPPTTGPGAVDLLDIDAVIDAARAAGADAIHPGFGFLAENADFAEAVIVSGVSWVGPPPDAIRAMGDKAAARRLAPADRGPR